MASCHFREPPLEHALAQTSDLLKRRNSFTRQVSSREGVFAPSLDECRSPFGCAAVKSSPANALQVHAPLRAFSRKSPDRLETVEDDKPSFGSVSKSLKGSLSMPMLTCPDSRRHRESTPAATSSPGDGRTPVMASPVKGYGNEHNVVVMPPSGVPRTGSRMRRASSAAKVISPATTASTSAPSVPATPAGFTPTPSLLSRRTPCSGAGDWYIPLADLDAMSSMMQLPTPSSAGSRPMLRERNWRRGEEIGSGNYGSVYKAQDQDDGCIFCVKVAKFNNRDAEDKSYCEILQKELDICKDLRHRHIVSCQGYEHVNKRLYIYFEYVPGGSLRKHISEFGALEGNILRKAARGVTKGLDYLHNCTVPVVHRDLKCANILVDLNFVVKLADFGCSKREQVTRSFTTLGSVCWMAPEVLQHEKGHGRRADIWSIGCCMIEMVTAGDPWGKSAFDNFMQAAKAIAFSERTPPIPEVLPDLAKDFIGRCLKRNPDERSIASELVEHDFVKASSSSSATSRAVSRASARRGA